MKILRFLIVLLAFAGGAWGISALFVENPSTQDAASVPANADDPALNGSDYYGIDPIAVQDGALPWTVFAETGEETFERTFPDGSYTFVIKPVFKAAMDRLDGQEVRLMGYMFPLDAAEQQTRFLFGPYPPSCPFHYHVNSDQVIEVLGADSIPFTYDPIALVGRLELLRAEGDGLFYRLKEARKVKDYKL